jgi:SAM-dependent methyltransferase
MQSSWESGDVVDFFVSQTRPELFTALQPFLTPGCTILDVGCGPGTFAISLAERLPQGRVFGVDGSQAMIERAAFAAGKQGSANVDFRKADVGTLPLEDGSVDIAVSCFLLEWVRDPPRAVAEQVRVVKRGGHVIAQAGDWGHVDLYPSCPCAERLWAALWNLSDPTYGFFIDIRCGRKLVRYFKDSGLVDVTISGHPVSDVAYAGSKAMAGFAVMLCPTKGGMGGAYFAPGVEELVRRGVIERQIVEQAERELVAWKADPAAVGRIGRPMIAIGRKP